METNKPLEFGSVDSLCESLKLSGINFLNLNWGSNPGTKSVEDLFEEIKSGQCKLAHGESSQLRRFLSVSRVTVTYDGQTLVEIYREGKTEKHTRLLEMKCSVADRINLTRKSFLGDAIQVVRRKLGLILEGYRFVNCGWQSEEKSSQYLSYPGLITVYNYSSFRLNISSSEFKKFYLATDGDEITYFSWLPDEVVEKL